MADSSSVDHDGTSTTTAAVKCAAAIAVARKDERCSPIVIGNCTVVPLYSSVDYIRLNATEPFVPPKPKEFEIAASIFIGRALLAQ